jgi:hypothetical protein
MIAKPPLRGRDISSREAVLPLLYCVKEDGLQMGLHAWSSGPETYSRPTMSAIGTKQTCSMR